MLRNIWVAVAAIAASLSASAATPPPIEVKVVVVTMFEIGADMGDAAGEFQLWRERQKLDERLPFAHHHDLYLNRATGVLGMVTGIGTANSATAVMALGLDPRFDLSKSYWLIAGIAGVDPADASIGSAAWAEYLVDGDLAHEIDAREIPADWPTGYFARSTRKPYDPNKPAPTGEMFRLNPQLTQWAYQRTRAIQLADTPELQKTRAAFKGYPNAQRPPFVLKGDNLAGMTFWHGKLLNDWADRWVSYWTDRKGNFVTSAMEDTGSFQALTYLHPTGKVDKTRAMVLRTASNYTMPPPGMSAAEHLLKENEGYAGLQASVEAAYVVGAAVVDEIAGNWSKYRDFVPGGGE
ncbi:MAG TPA: purine nucleoside permease [Steroidobacter sp.]|uniref:purine nucleoside permease n=1 Tax=Steroidobacter sp. TaxID=1978227 RepID=UPI002ED9CC9E